MSCNDYALYVTAITRDNRLNHMEMSRQIDNVDLDDGELMRIFALIRRIYMIYPLTSCSH